MLEKIKELSKDTAVYGISSMIGRFLGFFLTPFYTNVLLPNDFGTFSNIYAYIAFINVIFIYGTDAAYMKYASTATAERKKNVFSTSYLMVIVSTFVLSILLLLFKAPISFLMQIPEAQYRLFYYVVGIVALDAMGMVPYAKLRLERKAIRFSMIRFSNILLNLFLNFYLVLKLRMGIEAIFLANLIASLFSFIALMPDVVNELKAKIDKELLNRILRFGIPYLPAALAATIVNVVDRPVVLAMTNESTLGIYQANYKLGIFMSLAVLMFQFAWQPFFLNNAKEKNAKEIFSKVLTLFLLVTSVIWIILSLFIDDFARIPFYHGRTIIGKAYLSGLPIIPIILLGYLFNGVYYNFQAGIYIEEKTKYFPVVTGVGALTNVVVNIILIPVLGIIGAAIATLAAYMVMAGGSFYYSQKYYPIPYEYGKVARILLLIFVTGGIYYYLLYTIGIIFVYKVILLIGFFGMLFVLRVIDKNEIARFGKLLLRIK
jgi:O-antigen/teichoic acid export membrane protein